MPWTKRIIRNTLKSVINDCNNANSDTEITENIIIGLRPITSDIAPKIAWQALVLML